MSTTEAPPRHETEICRTGWACVVTDSHTAEHPIEDFICVRTSYRLGKDGKGEEWDEDVFHPRKTPLVVVEPTPAIEVEDCEEPSNTGASFHEYRTVHTNTSAQRIMITD